MLRTSSVSAFPCSTRGNLSIPGARNEPAAGAATPVAPPHLCTWPNSAAMLSWRHDCRRKIGGTDKTPAALTADILYSPAETSDANFETSFHPCRSRGAARRPRGAGLCPRAITCPRPGPRSRAASRRPARCRVRTPPGRPARRPAPRARPTSRCSTRGCCGFPPTPSSFRSPRRRGSCCRSATSSTMRPSSA